MFRARFTAMLSLLLILTLGISAASCSRQEPPPAPSVAASAAPVPERDYLRTVYDPMHFKPAIDSTFPLAKAAQAHARMESSAHIGKIVQVT